MEDDSRDDHSDDGYEVEIHINGSPAIHGNDRKK